MSIFEEYGAFKNCKKSSRFQAIVFYGEKRELKLIQELHLFFISQDKFKDIFFSGGSIQNGRREGGRVDDGPTNTEHGEDSSGRTRS